MRKRTPGWHPELRCSTSDRQSTPCGPTTWHTTETDEDRRRQTETDEDRGRQTETDEDRRRQTKTDGDRRRQTKTDEDRRRQTETDEDRLTVGTSELSAPWQLSTVESETQNWNLLLSNDPLTPDPMKVVAVSAAPGPFVEPPSSPVPELAFRKT